MSASTADSSSEPAEAPSRNPGLAAQPDAATASYVMQQTVREGKGGRGGGEKGGGEGRGGAGGRGTRTGREMK